MKIVQAHSKFFIIGNADEQNSIVGLIHEDDIVVRFNNPNPNCTLMADWVFIANGYTQIRHLNIDHQFFKPDTQIFFRYTRKDIFLGRYENIPLHKRIKYIWRFPKWKRQLGLYQYKTEVIPSSEYLHCVALLNHKLPSTGLLAISYILNQYPNNQLYLHNFTNKGWFGHNWQNEKKLIQLWENNNYLILV